MKGIVFTEFLDFVAIRHGDDMVDDVIADADLPHGGAFTSVGTYPFQEMQRLVVSLCTRTKLGAGDLLQAFGNHLCERFVVKFPEFFADSNTLFDFLESVDRHIHVEVRKLYADAELPRFATRYREPDRIGIDYASCRPLESLAEGMIAAAARHYGEAVVITRRRHDEAPEPYTHFVIARAA